MMREIEDLGPLSWNAKIIYTNQVQNLSSTFFLDELLSLDIYGRNKFYCYFDLPAKVVDTNPRLRHVRTHFIGLVLIFEQLFKVISSVFFSAFKQVSICVATFSRPSGWERLVSWIYYPGFNTSAIYHYELQNHTLLYSQGSDLEI